MTIYEIDDQFNHKMEELMQVFDEETGEVTDVDAITGGFNLQAAWSMAYVAAHAMTE